MKLLIVIPMYNEENKVFSAVTTLRRFCQEQAPWKYELLLADNGSTDRTWVICRRLAVDCPEFRCLHLEEKGRGRALRRAWQESQADVLSYMDVDLSTGLDAFPPMIHALAGGEFDLATGSRLLKGSRTRRCWRREALSRGYNALVRMFFKVHFSDAQCGFKAITRRAATELLPLVEDNQWFFDTELMILAGKLGYRIFDLPVRWVENPDSRVQVCRTIIEDVRCLLRLRRQGGKGEGQWPEMPIVTHPRETRRAMETRKFAG